MYNNNNCFIVSLYNYWVVNFLFFCFLVLVFNYFFFPIYIASIFQTFVLQSWPVEITVSLSNHTNRVICDWGCAFLIIVCLDGLASDQIIIVVSNEPLATNWEFGDQATQLTRALWKPHSCLWAG